MDKAVKIKKKLYSNTDTVSYVLNRTTIVIVLNMPDSMFFVHVCRVIQKDAEILLEFV